MPPVSLTLTRSELLAVLQVMGASTMNGLGSDPWAGLSETQVEEQLNSGVQTLITRNLMEFKGDDQLIMDDALVALVGAALIPEAVLLLTQVQPDGTSDPHYFNATPEVLVEHFSPHRGVFVFNHMPQSGDMQERVQELLQGLEEAPKARDFRQVTADQTLGKVLEASRTNRADEARSLLTRAGWSADDAEQFVRDNGEATLWTGLAASGLRGEAPPPNRAVMILQSRERCWLIEPTDDPAQLLVQITDGKSALDSMSHLLNILSDSLSQA